MRYAEYTQEQLNEHLSNFLINSWSYSAVKTFARNMKAFEMNYIYCERGKDSISSIVGNAYHKALEVFFTNVKDSVPNNFENILQVAFDYIDNVAPNSWKLTDKTNTVELATIEATKKVNALITSFFEEKETYNLDEIEEILGVEMRFEEWVHMNGVDIPLPCHAVADLVVRLKDGKVVIIDHKSKGKYTSEEEVALTHGQQAITYVLVAEKSLNVNINEVWFVENKFSKNRDKSAQLVKHIVVMDNDSRTLYEAMLYEPLRELIKAVSDPDHVYVVNPDDMFSNKAELYDFWARTQICEVVDFDFIPEDKRPLIESRKRKIKDSSTVMITPKVITDFRNKAKNFVTLDYTYSNMAPEERIEHAFRSFGKIIKVAHIITGFSCDTYLCEVSAGQKITDLFKHRLDIANALNVSNIRFDSELVVYEGKAYFAIEVTKKRTEDLLWDSKYLDGYKIPLGLDNFREPVIWDLKNQSTPHMLICGATGSGKSVSILSTIKYAELAGVRNIIVLDPKYEFTELESNTIHIYQDIDEIELRLMYLVEEMEKRVKSKQKELTLVIFDEFADALMQSRSKKEMALGEKTLEENLQMLLQKGRSSGFRFICATQRADTKTINGTTKVNLPVQMCFRVPKAIDSKVVLDDEGANMLAGSGDGLFKSPEYLDKIKRFQGFYYK